MRVALRDFDGDTVMERKVNSIPIGEEPPGIIMWGVRLFVHTSTTDQYPTPDNEQIHMYREAYLHHIPI